MFSLFWAYTTQYANIHNTQHNAHTKPHLDAALDHKNLENLRKTGKSLYVEDILSQIFVLLTESGGIKRLDR